jgi:hypothetical protein
VVVTSAVDLVAGQTAVIHGADVAALWTYTGEGAAFSLGAAATLQISQVPRVLSAPGDVLIMRVGLMEVAVLRRSPSTPRRGSPSASTPGRRSVAARNCGRARSRATASALASTHRRISTAPSPSPRPAAESRSRARCSSRRPGRQCR